MYYLPGFSSNLCGFNQVVDLQVLQIDSNSGVKSCITAGLCAPSSCAWSVYDEHK